ncbi:MAG: hypothetical protein U0R24_10420 [Solirubrobacterales bacterium]
MRRSCAGTALLTSALLLALPGTAGAATTVGALSVPDVNCGPTVPTVVQTTSPSALYEAPAAGVITSWSTQTSADQPATMRLRVVRRTASPTSFTTIGLSAAEALTDHATPNFATRIPVAAGDLLGYSVSGIDDFFRCGTSGFTGFATGVRMDAPGIGSSDTYTASATMKLPISAKLEPDADGDGFGDETQDACPTDATTQGPCPAKPDTTPPETTITNSPNGKTTKKRATLNFTADDPTATFECAFDGSAFTACTSPTLKKNLARGKHVFLVRSTDAAGNMESTPARAEWKVVKKRKKGHKH